VIRSGRWLLLVLTLVAVPIAEAQRVYVTPQVGLRLGGSWEDVINQKYDVNEHLSLGGAIGIWTDSTGGIELSYSGQPTSVRVTDTLFAKRDLDLSIHEFAFTGWREFGPRGATVQPVALGSAGVTWLTSDDAGESETTFMLAAGGGIRIWSKDRRVGLRFDGRVFFSFLPGSSQVQCVLPGGCLFQWNDGVLIQTELAAGVIVALGGRRQAR
jgi:hypothetical protein